MKSWREIKQKRIKKRCAKGKHTPIPIPEEIIKEQRSAVYQPRPLGMQAEQALTFASIVMNRL